MKFTIEGFSQKQLVEHNLDIVDAAILRYFIDFRDSGSMVSRLIDGKQYYWIKYDGIIEALPILKLNKSDSVYRRLKKMVEEKILESVTIKQGGIYSFYRTGSNYLKLIDDAAVTSDENPRVTDENPRVTDENPRVTDENPRVTDENPRVTDENPRVTDINPNHSDLYPEQNINLLYSSINNSSINNIVEIVGYLNRVVGTKYRSTNRKTKDLITARINEGFTIEDFKTVIDKKHKEWVGTDYEKFLRPETLFSNKFESYLNQKVNNPNIKNLNTSKGNFNNFEQRTYNFDELEKKLLGWGDANEQ